ncbi:MAG: hypothetical protein IT410_02540 [Candidatus Doudnabacteria bacterium]|nr:hypothetical protein [Candidatus Doudnabacteria bacterium]
MVKCGIASASGFAVVLVYKETDVTTLQYRAAHLLIAAWVLFFFVSPVRDMISIMKEEENVRQSLVPTLTQQEFEHRLDEWIRSSSHESDAGFPDPSFYPKWVAEGQVLEVIGRKIDNQPMEVSQDVIRLRHRLMSITPVINQTQAQMSAKHGGAQMARVCEDYFSSHENPTLAFDKARSDRSSLPSWWVAYLASLPFMALFFGLRLKREGLQIFPELVGFWRPCGAILAWPVMMWKYPKDIDPRDQLLRSLRYASVILGAILSVFSGGVGVVKAQTKDNGGKKSVSGFVFSGVDLGDVAGDGPKPSAFNILQFNLEKSWVRSTTFVDNSSLSERIDVGITKKLGQFTLKPYAGVGVNANFDGPDTYSVVAGSQFHWARPPTVSVSVPVLHVSKELNGAHATKFSMLGQATTPSRLKKDLRVGVEWNVGKKLGSRASWYAGPVISGNFCRFLKNLEFGVLFNRDRSVTVTARRVWVF